MLVDQGILSKKTLPIISNNGGSATAHGDITNIQFRSIQNDEDNLIESSEMHIVEVKKPKKLPSFKAAASNSPKRKGSNAGGGKSPERQVDLTQVLETIPDKNENMSIKNSTNENYF